MSTYILDMGSFWVCDKFPIIADNASSDLELNANKKKGGPSFAVFFDNE
jgi:hypothetical protein